MSKDLFYLQDSRSYVGNDLLFWRVGGGYTTNVAEAEAMSQVVAMKQHQSRHTDIPWPKDYIDSKIRPTVDHQMIKHTEAIAGTGIVILKDSKPRVQVQNCHGCGRFLTATQIFMRSGCPHCGADNRP